VNITTRRLNCGQLPGILKLPERGSENGRRAGDAKSVALVPGGCVVTIDPATSFHSDGPMIRHDEPWVQIAYLNERNQIYFTDEFLEIMGELGWEAKAFAGHR
jgi:hypothetical protein